jgi:rubrerythrin
MQGAPNMNIFNIAEVIDMGIEKEKKRRDFYGLVAERSRDERIKNLFFRLKTWEEEHIRRFGSIRDSAKAEEAQESYEGEFAAYMKALVDDKLYRQVSAKEFSKNVKSPVAAIQYALGFEKDAILFFNELLKFMEPYQTDKVRELIEEEKRHIIYLAKLKKKYE